MTWAENKKDQAILQIARSLSFYHDDFIKFTESIVTTVRTRKMVNIAKGMALIVIAAMASPLPEVERLALIPRKKLSAFKK